jgi:heme/copper-type cytochrome/quinol oxidase subunit 1
MPRRIVDYPDFYATWNLISTFGATVSLIATFLFFYIVYDMFLYGAQGKKAPYALTVLTAAQLVECFLLNSSKKQICVLKIFKGWYMAPSYILREKHFCTWFFGPFIKKKDVPSDCQYGFQDPGSLLMESLIDFHHDVMFFLI